MKTDEEILTWLAEKVMGWDTSLGDRTSRRYPFYIFGSVVRTGNSRIEPWDPLCDWAAAGEVLDQCSYFTFAKGDKGGTSQKDYFATVSFCGRSEEAKADSGPRAISLAVFKTSGGED